MRSAKQRSWARGGRDHVLCQGRRCLDRSVAAVLVAVVGADGGQRSAHGLACCGQHAFELAGRNALAPLGLEGIANAAISGS